jgi:glyoxylase-like metal-dependent hydrolase (beta-lactamase superfamily II)
MVELTYVVNPQDGETTYFVYDAENVVIIDPGFAGAAIIEELENLKNMGKVPAAIFLTHGHYDHIASVDVIREKYQIPVYINEKEAEWLIDPDLNLSGAWRHPDMDDVRLQPAENLIHDGETFKFGEIEFQALETPGHTLGGMCYYFARDSFIITGDTLFAGTEATNTPGAFGRPDLPTGNLLVLLNSIKRLFALPDDTLVYSGHSYYGVGSKMSYEKRHNRINDYLVGE